MFIFYIYWNSIYKAKWFSFLFSMPFLDDAEIYSFLWINSPWHWLLHKLKHMAEYFFMVFSSCFFSRSTEFNEIVERSMIAGKGPKNFLLMAIDSELTVMCKSLYIDIEGHCGWLSDLIHSFPIEFRFFLPPIQLPSNLMIPSDKAILMWTL